MWFRFRFKFVFDLIQIWIDSSGWSDSIDGSNSIDRGISTSSRGYDNTESFVSLTNEVVVGYKFFIIFVPDLQILLLLA